MQPSDVRRLVEGLPGTHPRRGEQLYKFIIDNKLRRCLELGFSHGVGTVWIAAALARLGEGLVVSVDNAKARRQAPSVPELLQRAGVSDRAELHYEPSSYTWFLKRTLQRYENDPFDFVFIDGAHTWDTDGFAFLLVERMLRPGGWILFDDMNWTFEASPSLRNSKMVRNMPHEERSQPQIRAVWDNLVLTHPAFGNFRDDGNWGWAQKVAAARPMPPVPKQSRQPPER